MKKLMSLLLALLLVLAGGGGVNRGEGGLCGRAPLYNPFAAVL